MRELVGKIDKNWLISEFKVFLTVTVAIFLLDTGTELLKQLYATPFDLSIYHNLVGGIFTSMVRALLTMVFPSVFSHGSQNPAQAEAGKINTAPTAG